jgi:hypothetical protein
MSQPDATDVYELRHPPQPVKLNSLMESAIAWCRQNHPGLEDSMRPERINSLLSIVATLVWSLTSVKFKIGDHGSPSCKLAMVPHMLRNCGGVRMRTGPRSRSRSIEYL